MPGPTQATRPSPVRRKGRSARNGAGTTGMSPTAPPSAGKKSGLPRLGGVGDLLDELNDGSANSAILYPPECLHQSQRICGIEKIQYVAAVITIAGRTESAAKKEQDWHHQDLGDLLQSGGFDTVGSRFVFLHLLERYAECATQRLL